MPPLALENNLFFLSNEVSDRAVLLRHPVALHSVCQARWPQALGHTPLPAWPHS